MLNSTYSNVLIFDFLLSPFISLPAQCTMAFGREIIAFSLRFCIIDYWLLVSINTFLICRYVGYKQQGRFAGCAVHRICRDRIGHSAGQW